MNEPGRSGIAGRVDVSARRLVAVAAAITTLIGLPLAIMRLIDAFSGGKTIQPSATLAVDPPEAVGETWGSFMRAHPNEVPDKPYANAQRETPGLVLPVELTLVGLAHRPAELRWTVLNPSGAVGNYEPPRWVPREREIRPSTSPVRLQTRIWIHPPPPQLDEEKIRVTVFDDHGNELGHDESTPLRAEPEP